MTANDLQQAFRQLASVSEGRTMKYRNAKIVDKTDDRCWTGRKHFWIANAIVRSVNCFEDMQRISHEETLRKLHRLGAEAVAFYANEIDV